MLFDMQVNQAIEANMVRPELPEEADRVEQLMVEFRHVPHILHDREAVLWIRIPKFLGASRIRIRHYLYEAGSGSGFGPGPLYH